MSTETAAAMRRAIADPGSVLPRGRDHHGLWPLYEWQARAVMEAAVPAIRADERARCAQIVWQEAVRCAGTLTGKALADTANLLREQP